MSRSRPPFRPSHDRPEHGKETSMNTTTSTDGTIIAYDRAGDGPPVILVHPAFGHRAFNPGMATIALLLADRYTVVNFDRRGRGDSGDTAPYAVEREIDDL